MINRVNNGALWLHELVYGTEKYVLSTLGSEYFPGKVFAKGVSILSDNMHYVQKEELAKQKSKLETVKLTLDLDLVSATVKIDFLDESEKQIEGRVRGYNLGKATLQLATGARSYQIQYAVIQQSGDQNSMLAITPVIVMSTDQQYKL